jgi:replicative DNA helicase
VDSEAVGNLNRDDDGVPAEVIRDSIRRSLESAQPPSNFFRFAAIDLDSEPPFLPQEPEPEIEIGPPRSHRRQDGIFTGFRDFDSIVGGLRNGELITVAGLPSSGSSTFIQNIVRRSVAGRFDRAVAFFTLDITRAQVVQRLLGAEAKIDWHSASAGLLRDAEWDRLTEAVQQLWNSKLVVTDDHLVSLDDIYETCVQRKRGIGLDLIVLDRVNVLGMDYSGITPPLGETMAELKAIAERLEVPVVVTFTADPALADDRTHRLDARSVPPAVQVYSDVLTFLHRPDQWERQDYGETSLEVPEPQKGLEVVELNVARQAAGPSDTLRLAFNARWGRFDNVLWD